MRHLTILCDVDDVVAGLSPEWIRRYNRKWNDDFSVEKMVSFDIDNLVKPECGKRIFDILDCPHFYKSVQPVRGAIGGVNCLRRLGHRVVFVSACGSSVAAKQKMEWLQAYGFLPQGKGKGAYGDWAGVIDKTLLLGDVMIDDAPHNLIGTNVDLPVVLDMPWNQDMPLLSDRLAPIVRAMHWGDVIRIVEEFAQREGGRWQMN